MFGRHRDITTAVDAVAIDTLATTRTNRGDAATQQLTRNYLSQPGKHRLKSYIGWCMWQGKYAHIVGITCWAYRERRMTSEQAQRRREELRARFINNSRAFQKYLARCTRHQLWDEAYIVINFAQKMGARTPTAAQDYRNDIWESQMAASQSQRTAEGMRLSPVPPSPPQYEDDGMPQRGEPGVGRESRVVELAVMPGSSDARV